MATKKKTSTEAEIIETPQPEDVSPVVEEPKKTTRTAPKRVTVDLNDIVCVQSCFHGNLFYKSKRNGSIIEWNRFGEDQYMDVDELMYMRNTYPTFFKEQWIRLVGDNADDVFAFLHLDRYCKNNLSFDSFDDVFEMDTATMTKVVKEFAPSLRESFARRAMELIENETLTDLKTIKAIEAATGYKLIQ